MPGKRVVGRKPPATRAAAVRSRAAYKGKSASSTSKYKKYAYAKAKRENVKDEGPLSSLGALGGSVIGGSYGGAPGAMIGNFLGSKLGHLVEKITGFGDYKLSSNSLMRGGMRPLQVANSMSNGGFVIRHREYIGDIKASDVFTLHQYPLNPGQRQTFPWLSTIASNFEQYRFRGVIFEVVSTASDAVLSSNASASLGTISMATDYDAIDAPFTNKRAMLNSMFANSNKPSCGYIHPIECKITQTPLRLQYIRPGGVPANADVRMYDLGNTYLATEGMQGSAPWGTCAELWVTYEVELYKQTLGSTVLTDHWFITSPTSGGWLGPAANLHTLTKYSSIGGTINDAGVSYTYPSGVASGQFLWTYYVYGTSSATIGEINLTLSNCSLMDYWGGPSISTLFVQAPPTGTNSQYLMAQFVVLVTGADASVTFGTATIPAGTTKADLWITEIESEIDS